MREKLVEDLSRQDNMLQRFKSAERRMSIHVIGIK